VPGRSKVTVGGVLSRITVTGWVMTFVARSVAVMLTVVLKVELVSKS